MKNLLIVLILACVAAPAAAGTLPRFAEYPVSERFTSAPVMPDFSIAPAAKKFMGQIRSGSRNGPNFAGRYTIVDWGCGSECQSFVIVDAKTGAIFQPDVTAAWGLLYKRDSNLLIVNPLIPDVRAGGPPPEWLVSRYYTWDGRKLTQVAENRTAVIDPQTGEASAPAEQKKLSIIDYFNMNDTGYLKIEQKDGIWKGMGESGSYHPMKVTDIANGYLEYEDPEYNNGGLASYSAALFLDKDRKPMLALLVKARQGHEKCEKTDYTLTTYRLQGDQMVKATDVMPALSYQAFMKKGVTAKKNVAGEYSGTTAIGYRLPQKGTTAEAFLDASTLACTLDNFSNNLDKTYLQDAKEFLQNVRKDPLKLKWNKATGRFDPPAEQ